MKLIDTIGQTNWKYIFIVVLLSLVVAVGGILLLKVIKPVPSFVPNEQPTINNQQSTIDTSDWQIYRNDEFGFELKYPSDWEYGYDNPLASKRAQFTHINLIEDPTRSISVQVVPDSSIIGRTYDPYKLSLDKHAARLFSEYEIVELQGVSAIKSLRESGGFIILHHNPNFEIFINDTSLVAERGSYNFVEKEFIDRIVSTFRFIEVVDIADWKIYRGDGFEVMYPEKLDTQYVRIQQEPKIMVVQDSPRFVCGPLGREVYINSQKYCGQMTSDHAAGTLYRNYEYTINKEGAKITLEFTLAYPNCGNFYEIDNKQEECNGEEETFNPDILADQILSTFRFVE